MTPRIPKEREWVNGHRNPDGSWSQGHWLDEAGAPIARTDPAPPDSYGLKGYDGWKARQETERQALLEAGKSALSDGEIKRGGIYRFDPATSKMVEIKQEDASCPACFSTRKEMSFAMCPNAWHTRPPAYMNYYGQKCPKCDSYQRVMLESLCPDSWHSRPWNGQAYHYVPDPKIYEGINPVVWTNTYKFLLLFSFAKDYHTSTRWVNKAPETKYVPWVSKEEVKEVVKEVVKVEPPDASIGLDEHGFPVAHDWETGY